MITDIIKELTQTLNQINKEKIMFRGAIMYDPEQSNTGKVHGYLSFKADELESMFQKLKSKAETNGQDYISLPLAVNTTKTKSGKKVAFFRHFT